MYITSLKTTGTIFFFKKNQVKKLYNYKFLFKYYSFFKKPYINVFLCFFKNKAVFSKNFIPLTFSVGMILKSLSMSGVKFLRRNSKGYKILLNFIIFSKFFFLKKIRKNNNLIVFFKTINNRFFFLKKKITKMFFKNKVLFFLLNMGIAYSLHKTGKKIKSIKKRLKKKILIDSLGSF